MNARKLSVWGFVAVLFALALFTLAANRVLFLFFAPLSIFVLAYHATFVCRRCTNVSCALNGKSPDFFLRLRRREPEDGQEELTFSDIHTLRQGLLPMTIPIVLGVIGTAQFSMFALLGVIAASLVLYRLYARATCRYCTNDCRSNKNAKYWEWKRAREAH